MSIICPSTELQDVTGHGAHHERFLSQPRAPRRRRPRSAEHSLPRPSFTLKVWALVGRWYMGASINWGLQNGPKYILVLIIGTSKMGPLIVGKSHIVGTSRDLGPILRAMVLISESEVLWPKLWGAGQKRSRPAYINVHVYLYMSIVHMMLYIYEICIYIYVVYIYM